MTTLRARLESRLAKPSRQEEFRARRAKRPPRRPKVGNEKLPIAGKTRPIDESEEKLNNIEAMIPHPVDKKPAPLKCIAGCFKGRVLKVAAICSGSDAPIFFLNLLTEDLELRHNICLPFEQLFCAEISPFKQAFLERNFHPQIIFSDVSEFSEPNFQEGKTATTTYGSQAQVPGALDILFVGPSCKDFSALNNEKKTLAEKGESGITFEGLFDYMIHFAPKSVVIENVTRVPWDSIRRTVETRTGYACVSHKTRGRQYMLSVSRTKIKDAKHYTTASFESTLRHSLVHTALSTSRGSLIEDAIQTSWTGSKQRHATHWTHEKVDIGPQKPLTHWDHSGSKRLPDYFEPIQGFTDRVLDLLDCVFLEYIKKGFYIRYYSRFSDCSPKCGPDPDNDSKWNPSMSHPSRYTNMGYWRL
ncbi:hypothetical protein BDZ45DRAFT_695110 [Acephala macrosclerotiorum]|nr:hypothetical protein BDZ45DRAFT_695110 [Acephala macrosclerotiorum]